MAKVTIQSVAQTDKAGLFSICFEGESYTEFQKFILQYKDNEMYSEELNTILAGIGKMMEGAGFLERRFRPEGKVRDNVCALPIETCKLRLYCLRLCDSILIVGNGGAKTTRTYDENEELRGYVLTLQKLDDALRIAIKKGVVTIEKQTINGIDNKQFEV